MTDSIAITEASDYMGEDGLLYCGVCHSRKQIRVKFPKLFCSSGEEEERIVPVVCKCYEREQEKIRQREHAEKVDRMKSVCFTDRAYHDWTLDKADQLPDNILKICRAFIDSWAEISRTNTGLLFWGGVGNGKSTAAACIANALLEKEISVLMRNTGAFMNGSFDDREELIREVSRYSLVIIDDFGMERDTQYGKEVMFSLIDARYNSKKPTIITTNLTLSALQHPAEQAYERIYDRILEMCTPIRFEGSSLRPGIQKQKLDHFKELLSEYNGGCGNGE